MENRDVLLGGLVGGLAGGLVGGLAGAAYCRYKQQEEQSQQTTYRDERGEYNRSSPAPTVQTPPIQRQQQTTRREEPKQYNPNPPSPTVQNTPIQRITKQYLVLVVSASQADFLSSIKDKRHIDLGDAEALYEITRYLWLGSENEYSQKIANVNQYSVSQGEESEYNVYLVSIELKQADEGFKHNINQLDRYDAFRKLADLIVDVRVSDRLRINSYENFEVYNR